MVTRLRSFILLAITAFLVQLSAETDPAEVSDSPAEIPTGTSGAEFTIKKDPQSPWSQLSVSLPLQHAKWEQFIAKVVDLTVGIPQSMKDVNRTFLASVEDASMIKIHNLHPGHKYSISIVGRKGDSSEYIKEETVIMDPQAPVFDIEKDVMIHETNMTLKTKKMNKAVQDLFKIEYRQLNPEEKYPALEVLDIPEQNDLEIYLGNLNPGREYRIRVTAVCDDLKSQAWNGVITTKPTMPTSLSATDLPPNCVKLEWKMGAESGTDGYEIEYGTKGGEHVNKLSVASEAREALLCDSVQPGKMFKFAVASRKGSIRSSPTTVEHNIRPFAPLDFKAKPDITKGKYRIVADLPANSHFEKCHLTVVNEALERVESVSEVEKKKAYTSCTFFLPLIPGERYEFSVSTSANDVYSTKLQKSIVLGPAFDMKGFGLNIQESKSGLELQWPQSEVFMSRMKDLWSKVVGSSSVLQMRVAPIDRSKSREKTRQFESNPNKGESIVVPGLKKGACYQVQIYTVTRTGIVSESRYNESIRMAAPLVTVVLENVTHTTGTLRIEIGNNTIPSHNESISDCLVVITVNDMHSMVVFDRRLPLTTVMSPIDLNGLRPFHKYTVNSQVVCGISSSTCPSSTRTMKQLSFSTRQDRPGPVQALLVKALNPYSVQLTWLPPALPNGIVTHYVVGIQPVDPNQEPWSVNVPLSNKKPDHTIESIIDGLYGGEDYKFEVRAVTEAGSGEPPASTDITTVTMPIMAPPRSSSTLEVVPDTVTPYTMTVRYTTQMFDGKHGRITRSALIVAEVTDDGRVSETWLYSENKTYTWAEVQRFDVWPAFTATLNDVPATKKNAPTRVISEVIGSNPNCRDLPADVVCNGPLKPGTTYKYKLRIFTAPNLWTDTEYSSIAQTEHLPSGFSLKAAVLSLTCVVLFGLLCVLCLTVWNRSKSKRNPSYTANSKEGQWAALKMIMAERAADCLAKLGLDGSTNCDTVNCATVSPTQPATPQSNLQQPAFGHHRRCRSLRERTGVDHRLERLPSGPSIHRTPLYTVMSGTNTNKSRPVRIQDFSEHTRLMSADSDFRFSEEYEQLKNVGIGQSFSAAELPVNRVKNRFTNILPYDHSRVKLINVEDEEGSDYINANYMPGFSSRREFIAAQGPLPSTRDQFWQMTWEQQCPAIIALTKCVEKGRDKCHQYWPDAEHMSVLYGDIEVTLMSETQYDEFTIRELRLCNLAENSPPRLISHLHYMAWPDFGVPEHPQGIVRFARLFRSKLPHSPHNKPTIVHCSAGVGRSGTFMAMDRLVQTIGVDRPIDVFGIVYEMRLERCHMVQNEQQYIFIHHCLSFVLQSGSIADWSSSPVHITSNASEWVGHLPNSAPRVEIHQNPAFIEDDEGIAESGF